MQFEVPKLSTQKYRIIAFWDFSAGEIPESTHINSRLKLIGDQHIHLREWRFTPGSPKAFLQHKGMQLGLGGIAKGYALDQAMHILKEGGIKNALIFAGGDILTISDPHFKNWRIAIEHPRKESPLGVLELGQGAVATSGDYEKYFIKNGRRYHHIIDPRTGFPPTHTSSVTVVTNAGIKADAWATALFILEPEKAMTLVESISSLDAIIVTAAGEVLMSDGIKDRIQLID